MRTTIDFGIDLGTTNSAIALFEGSAPRFFESEAGEVLLPSAVWLDAEGGAIVGADARRRFASDPDNTALEFKRSMGTADIRRFAASGMGKRAEELSALVIGELLGRAKRHSGETPAAAVITVPAMFQLPQCEATQKAAKLAGLAHAPLLQEPIAAAMAHAGTDELREGIWLVYDLGGGTFDVSLVRSREGRLQVIDHDGDNHLGGRDFDRVLVRYATEQISSESTLAKLRRADGGFSPGMSALKHEAERVRMQLSTAGSARFSVPELELSFELQREQLEGLLAPTVDRTLRLAKKVLARNRVASGALRAVVMVGGPTRTPLIAASIQSALGIETRHVIDPMHVVATGAAIYASTQRVPLALRAQVPTRADEVQIDLNYVPMTTDPTPLIAGRVVGERKGATAVRVVRSDNGFSSDWLELDAAGAFSTKLELQRSSSNVFRIQLRSAGAQALVAQPAEVRVLHGFSVSKPPLSQSVGVLMADGSVSWYVRKGAALPTRQRMVHSTTIPLKRDQSGTAVNVPIVQGESTRGDRNKVIGVLCIKATHISRDVPAGTEVQVTLTVDESSRASATAYVPLLDQTFDDVMRFELETKSADAVKKELSDARSRLEELAAMAHSLETEGPSADARVAEIDALVSEAGAGGGEGDDLRVAEQLLRAFATDLDGLDLRGRVARLEERFSEELRRARSLAASHGAAGDAAQVEALAREYAKAKELGDIDRATATCDDLEGVVARMLWRIPEFWHAQFERLSNQLSASGEAAGAIAAGRRAKEQNAVQDLVDACLQLYRLLPQEERGDSPLGLMSNVR